MVKPLPSKAKTEKVFPPGLDPTTPADILKYAKSRYFYFLHETMKYKTTPANIFNPDIPFGGIFELFCQIGWDICEPTLWLIWCNTVQYSIPIALQTKWPITSSQIRTKIIITFGPYWNGILPYLGGEQS